jgi:hypothetical protein
MLGDLVRICFSLDSESLCNTLYYIYHLVNFMGGLHGNHKDKL